MTNFERVAQTCRMFGKTGVDDLADPEIKAGVSMLAEELEELLDAMHLGYLPEIRKELCDLLVVTYQLGYLLGFEVDKDLAVVDDNNRSKVFTDDETELMVQTSEMYRKLGVDVVLKPTTHKHWACVSKCDQIVDGKFYPEGKALKPAHYQKLELS